MPIKHVIEILESFQRYVDWMNDHGQDDMVSEIKAKDDKLLVAMRGHCGEKYGLTVYLGIDNELCIEDTVTGIDVLDTAHFIEDYEITDDIMQYLRFGTPLEQEMDER